MARRVVRIASLADQNGWITNQTFEDCEIIGPAVLNPQGCSFDTCELPGPFESFLWPLPPRRVYGLLHLRNVQFRRCRFSRTVGMAADEATVQEFLKDVLR